MPTKTRVKESSSATSATITLEEPKALHITFPNGDRKPTFVFTGDWTGRDTKTVMSHIFREYRFHQRNTRAANPDAINHIISANEEDKL